MNRYLAILKIVVVLLFISGTINAQNADPHQNIGSEITGLPTEKVLLILDISVHDLLQYEKYQMQLEPIVKAHGGTYLVRSSGKTFDDNSESKLIPVEGNWNPNRLIVLQWNSMKALQKFSTSKAYRNLLPLRIKATTTKSLIVTAFNN